jgi:predicted nucleic acid-binding protein
MRSDRDTEELEKYLNRQNLCITSPTVFEIWSGAVLSKRTGEEREKIRGLLEYLDVLEMDAESAMEGAEIYAGLVKEGREIPPIDAMIAGIVRNKGEKLITRNEHFRRVEGLSVEVWKD